MLDNHPVPFALLVPLTALAALAGATVATGSGQELGFVGGPWVGEQTPIERLRPDLDGYKDGSQRWGYVLRFDDGTVVQLSFLVTGIGPGHHTGVFLAHVIDPDGTATTIRNTRRFGEWQDLSDDAQVGLHIAHHTLRIRHPVHELRIDTSDRGRLSIDARVVTSAFSPGRLLLEGDTWLDIDVPGPRLRAAGWIELPGQPRRELEEGRGIAIHTRTDSSDEKLATGWLRIDTFGPGTGASLFEMMASERHYRRRLGFLLEFDGDRLVGHTFRYGRRLVDVRPDPDRRGYPIPSGIRFGADSEIHLRGEGSLEAVVRSPLLDALNSALLRGVLRLFADPIFYLYRGTVTLRADEEAPGHDSPVVVSLYLLAEPPVVY